MAAPESIGRPPVVEVAAALVVGTSVAPMAAPLAAPWSTRCLPVVEVVEAPTVSKAAPAVHICESEPVKLHASLRKRASRMRSCSLSFATVYALTRISVKAAEVRSRG